MGSRNKSASSFRRTCSVALEEEEDSRKERRIEEAIPMSGTPSLDSMLQLGRLSDDSVDAAPAPSTDSNSDQSLSPNAADMRDAGESQDTAMPLFSQQSPEAKMISERRSSLALQKSLEKYGARVNSSRADRHMMTPVDHEKGPGYVLPCIS